MFSENLVYICLYCLLHDTTDFLTAIFVYWPWKKFKAKTEWHLADLSLILWLIYVVALAAAAADKQFSQNLWLLIMSKCIFNPSVHYGYHIATGELMS